LPFVANDKGGTAFIDRLIHALPQPT
jgi:hypothetical protein